MTRRRLALVVAAVAAVAGLLTVGTWAVTRASGRTPSMMSGSYGSGMMGGQYGSGMMAGSYGLPGDGRRVDSLAAAGKRAQAFGDRLGLRAGEIMQFSNGFYAELLAGDGQGATEVLIDPAGGAVGVEYGPAMMWNTSYGMHAGAAAALAVSPADAARLAQRWLDDRRRGLTAGEPEQFPGYYTLHTLRNGKIDGMLSVNGFTGTVWYHTWHRSFIAMSEE